MVYVPDLILVLISGITGLYNMKLIHTPVGGRHYAGVIWVGQIPPTKAGCSTLTLTSCFQVSFLSQCGSSRRFFVCIVLFECQRVQLVIYPLALIA